MTTAASSGESQWRVDLKEFIEAVMDERDKRYEQRFQSQERAIAKAESATDRRLEGMNEFRGTLKDQQNTLIPRTEVVQLLASMSGQQKERDAALDSRLGTLAALIGSAMPRNEVEERFKASDAKIEILTAADKLRTGRSSGFESTRVLIFALLAAVGTITSIILAFTK